MHRVAATSIVLWVLACAHAFPQALPEAAETRARGAVVLVRPPKGAGANPGSGFLLRKDGEGGVVLTSDWCVGAANEVDIVFRAGTAEERAVAGQVLGLDPTRGLATIRLADPRLPDAIPLAAKTELKETETVYPAGYRGAETLPSPLPAVEFLKCNVSSFRRNDRGQLQAVQLAGDIALGQTGGPLLDKTGRAAGLTVGKIPGTQTAFAVPVEEIHDFLAGDWVEIVFTVTSLSDTKAKVDVSVSLSNPQGSMRNATLSWGRKDACRGPKEPLPPDKNGDWVKAYAAAKDTLLKIREGKGEATIELDRRSPGESQTEVVIQFKLSDGGGKTTWSPPWSAYVMFDTRRASKTQNPNRARYVPPPRVEGPAVTLTPLETAASFPEAGRQGRNAVLGDLHLSPDGSEILLLDFTEGKLLRVEAATMKSKSELVLPTGVSALTVSPDWKTAWLAFRVPAFDEAKRPSTAGEIRRCRLADLKLEDPVGVEYTIRELAATDAGLLVVSPDRGDLRVFDPVKKTELARGSSGWNLTLHPSQQCVYLAHGSPWSPAAIPVAASPAGRDPTWTCPCDRANLPGRLAISGDGKWLVLSNGAAGKIAAARETDFVERVRIDPALDVAIPPGSSTLFSSTTGGTLRESVLGEFRTLKEVPVGAPLVEMAVDPAKKRLYAVAVREKLGDYYWKRRNFVGDLVAISLGGDK